MVQENNQNVNCSQKVNICFIFIIIYNLINKLSTATCITFVATFFKNHFKE